MSGRKNRSKTSHQDPPKSKAVAPTPSLAARNLSKNVPKAPAIPVPQRVPVEVRSVMNPEARSHRIVTTSWDNFISRCKKAYEITGPLFVFTQTGSKVTAFMDLMDVGNVYVSGTDEFTLDVPPSPDNAEDSPLMRKLDKLDTDMEIFRKSYILQGMAFVGEMSDRMLSKVNNTKARHTMESKVNESETSSSNHKMLPKPRFQELCLSTDESSSGNYEPVKVETFNEFLINTKGSSLGLSNAHI